MGFWSTVGELATKGLKKLNEQNNIYREAEFEMSTKSDAELKRIYSSSPSIGKKAAAARELKQRGYSD